MVRNRHTGPGAHPATYTMGTGSVPGVMRPERGVDLLPLSSAEVKERVLHLSLFFRRACCYHTLFKPQLMHCNLKYTLKNTITPLKH